MSELTVETILGLKEGCLVRLTKGRASLSGPYKRITFFGWACEPALVMDEKIGALYDVVVMVKQGWKLEILAADSEAAGL